MKSMQEIVEILTRPLTPDEMEWRVQQAGMGANGPWAKIVPYKTARTDRARLNEAVGPFGWRSTTQWGEFTEYIKDPKNPKGPKIPVLRVGFTTWIEIKDPDTGEWSGKYGCAAGTDIEAFKGGDSDSFKRAGFAWGIGEELYDMDVEWADCSSQKKPGYEYASGSYYNKQQEKWVKFTYYWKPKRAGRVAAGESEYRPDGPEATPPSEPQAQTAPAPAATPAPEPAPAKGEDGYKGQMLIIADIGSCKALPHLNNIYRKYKAQATEEGWHDMLVSQCEIAKDRIYKEAGVAPHPAGGDA